MNLFNQDFLNIYPNNWGTENVSLFLYSLIKTQRPSKLLEIGAGYSTFFIAQALKDIKHEIYNNPNPSMGIHNDHWCKEYNPILNVIENESSENTSLKEISKNLSKLKLDKFVKITKQNASYINDNSRYDFIWWDAGAGEKMFYFFQKFLNVLLEGGILVIHSTLTNLYGKLFITQLKLEINKGKYSDLELITFLEPHKSAQNSFTVIKKTTNDPIYSIYS